MPELPPLADLADYHADAEAALRLLYSAINPDYGRRFTNYLNDEINEEFAEQLAETGLRSSLITLAQVEAAFRVDYRLRCKLKKADEISIKFRKIYKARKERARLDEDIIATWYQHVIPQERAVISQLRGMLKFRHWLAHGRYWIFGHKFVFEDVYLIADAVTSGLPLYS